MMIEQVRRCGAWLPLAGVLALLLGLSWDVVLHRLDPALAEREGVFSLTNPGHLLFAAGIALSVAGVSLSLVERALATTGRARLALAGGAAGLLALAGVSVGSATWSGSSLTGMDGHTGAPHVRGNETAHPHHQEHTAVAAGGAGTATPGHQHAAEVGTASQVKAGVVHEHGETVAVTAEQIEEASRLVADVRAASARFENFDVADAEGYRRITAGQVITHYHNQAYHGDGRILDPERPEQLIYVTLPTGERRLAGVMFLMPDSRPGPRIGGPLTVWHAHDNLCFNLAGVVAALKERAGQCPSGTRFIGKTPEMLHVWLVDNPSGVFGEDMTPQTILKAMGINQ